GPRAGPCPGNAGEGAQLARFRFRGTPRGGPGQRRGEREQVVIGPGRGDDVGMEPPPLVSAAMDLAALPAGALDQDPTHGRGRRREEMTTPAPALRRGTPTADELQIRLVNQGRRLERLAGRLPGQPSEGELAEFVVDGWQ